MKVLGSGEKQVNRLAGGSTALDGPPTTWKTPGLPASPANRPARRLLGHAAHLFPAGPWAARAQDVADVERLQELDR